MNKLLWIWFACVRVQIEYYMIIFLFVLSIFVLFCLFWIVNDSMKAKIQEEITRDWNKSERYCFCYCCCSETFAHRHRIKIFHFVCSRNAPYFTLMHLKLLVEYKSNNSNKCNVKNELHGTLNKSKWIKRLYII